MNRFARYIAALGMVLTMAVAPVFAAQSTSEPVAVAAPENQEVTVVIQGNNVHISGAAKQTLVIYNLTGEKAASYAIDSDDKVVTINLPKRVYLLKVGKVVRKISIQ